MCARTLACTSCSACGRTSFFSCCAVRKSPWPLSTQCASCLCSPLFGRNKTCALGDHSFLGSSGSVPILSVPTWQTVCLELVHGHLGCRQRFTGRIASAPLPCSQNSWYHAGCKEAVNRSSYFQYGGYSFSKDHFRGCPTEKTDHGRNRVLQERQLERVTSTPRTTDHELQKIQMKPAGLT